MHQRELRNIKRLVNCKLILRDFSSECEENAFYKKQTINQRF